MASIFIHRDKIYMNIRINGKQVRKSTGLVNNKANRLIAIREILPKFVSASQEP